MELHNNELKPIPDVLSLNMDHDQYAFENRMKTFDPNLSSVARYSPTPSTSTAVNPYNVQSNDTIVAIPETSTNCITYSNIIFLPTNSTNGLDQVVDAIEMVKNENDASTSDCIDAHSFKYIVSSDQRFMNTFIQTSGIDGANHVSNSYIDQSSSNMIATIAGIGENNLILNDTCTTEPHHEQLNMENHSLAVQVQSKFSHIEENGTEIIMQAPDGQLYRPVHNIYLNNEQTNGDEILPTIISEPLTFTDIEFTQPNQFDPDTFHNVPSDHGNYNDPTSFMESSPSLGTMTVYNEYKGSKLPNEQFHMDHINVLETHQMPQYQTNPNTQVDKDQQRILLESTMSPLLAAVNITTREEQFQSYKTENDSSSSTNYYTHSDMANIGQSPIIQYTTAKISNPIRTVACVTKSHSTSTESSSTSEFVDYSEVKLVRDKEDGKGVPTKRAKLRKKTTKKRDDELSVADRIVPSRALASLPTSHLYFELQEDFNEGQAKRIVFTKREISVRTKFGPFEGNTKILTEDELNKYRKLKTGCPHLFLGPKTILDVSNENTSNWMRFVQLAKTYAEQNLQLCDYDSRLFFKACRTIASKRELRVGYSKEYAEKYNLNQLLPDENIEDGKKSNDWHCSKCKKQFSTIDLLQSHLEYHKLNATPPKIAQISSIRSTPSKNSESGSPVKSKHRLNTDAIRLRKLAQSKNSRTSGPTVRYACCYCSKVFSKFLNYKRHTNDVHSVDIEHKRFSVDMEHKRLTIEDSSSSKENNAKLARTKENIKNETINRINDSAEKWFVCQICQESFDSLDLLEKHRLTKCIKKESLSAQCSICFKTIKNPAALIMHMKTHGDETEIFQCIYCTERYKKTRLLRDHVQIHMKNGQYSCLHCSRTCPEYSSIRKHIRTVHSSTKFQCYECKRDFNSKYKLKEHSFVHSGIKQYLCADCGKQFKRKDKLREHILRMHATKNASSPAKSQKFEALLPSASKTQEASTNNMSITSNSESSKSTNLKSIDVPPRVKFQPKVSPTEYQRFIYKCITCMVGFKRRGMLVNHMAKLHPGVRIDSVHELSLPILKTQRCFYCLYCDKVYKSSTKRKAHILKNHPGQALPQSIRGQNEYENVNAANPSFSQNIGQITTRAHQCMWCYKQYASRNRLLQHQREAHKDQIQNPYTNDTHEYVRDQILWPVQHPNHFQTYELQNEYTTSHTDHHTQCNAEPENKLLRLSSAALEASIRDDVSFLETHHVLNEKLTNNLIVCDSSMSKVDVNFKIGDEYVDGAPHTHCDLNSTFPQLFEGIDYMSLRSSHFGSSNEHNTSGDSIGKVDFSN